MRFAIAFLFFVLTVSGYTQSNTEVPASNSGTTVNSISTGELQVDTLTIQKNLEIQQEKTDKKAKDEEKDYRSKAPQSLKKAEAKEEVSSSQEQMKSVSAVSTTFSMSKQQASTQRTQRSPSTIQQQQMDQVVTTLEESAPESFEYHYFKYVAGNYDIALIEDLKKAEALRPNNSDVQLQMAAYFMITKDAKNTLLYLEKLIASTRLSMDAVNYAEDLLLSVPENGTLITHGFDDSYATAYVQLSKKIRSDVTLISLDFMQSEAYRTLLKNTGYSLPSSTVIDVKYLQDFCSKNSSKSLAISLTTPKEYLVPIQQNLFVVGLVFEYHTDLTFSNFYKNDYLWDKVLKKTLINTAITEKAKQLSSNYLPMLLYLRKTYAQKGDQEKVKELDAALDKVAVQTKKYDQVQKLKSSY